MAKLWFAEPEFIKNYQERILNATHEQRVAAQAMFENTDLPDDLMEIKGDTAYINIRGVLSQDGPDWIDRYFEIPGTSYAKIIEVVNMAVENLGIKTICLVCDTPGGEVSGVDKVWQAVAAAAKVKDVQAWNIGMIASAGYYIACPADEIIADSPICLTGSIGVVISVVDYSGMYEKVGVKVVTVTSKNAPDKAPNIAKKEGIAVLQDHADALERIFYSRIASARGVTPEFIAENYGHGRVLVAQDPDPMMPSALKNGLIDRVEGLIKSPKVKSTEALAVAGSETEIEAVTPLEMEETTMKLDEFLSANPDGKAQFDKLQTEKYEAGVAAGKAEIEKRASAAAPYLAADSAYPAPFKALAAEVVTGKKSIDALHSAAAVFDAMKESEKSTAAKTETDNQPKTPAQQNGEAGAAVKTAAEVDALIAADKLAAGMV